MSGADGCGRPGRCGKDRAGTKHGPSAQQLGAGAGAHTKPTLRCIAWKSRRSQRASETGRAGGLTPPDPGSGAALAIFAAVLQVPPQSPSCLVCRLPQEQTDSLNFRAASARRASVSRETRLCGASPGALLSAHWCCCPVLGLVSFCLSGRRGHTSGSLCSQALCSFGVRAGSSQGTSVWESTG